MGIEQDRLKQNVSRIRAMLADEHTRPSALWGIPYDPENPDHVLVAAFYLGERQGAEHAYKASLDALLNEFAGPPPNPDPAIPNPAWFDKLEKWWKKRR